MTWIKRIGFFAIAAFGGLVATNPASGHTVFRKYMQGKYKNLQVKCEACHIKGKPKTERNEFGNLFFTILKDKDLTKQWEALKGEEKRKFEKETMTPAFEKALELVKEKKNDKDKKYGEMIAAGEIENMGIKKADDDDEEEDEEEDDKDGDGKFADRNRQIRLVASC
jgi:hypothetical protein